MPTPSPGAPATVNPLALHPIIYVRGYAMTRGEIDDTTADPFCGFNVGSTVYRATPDRARPARKFIFESPVVRLVKDFGYRDVFVDGEDVLQHDVWEGGIPRQSIVVYRYYESASSLLGTGVTPEIESFAQGLSTLVKQIQKLVLAHGEYQTADDPFQCYLVAHSMGGLVSRAFLQNPACDPEGVARYVDKFFTYATPHNGIDLGGANVPAWLGLNDINNFSRARMADYLGLGSLYKKTDRVDWIPEDRFPSDKVFCLVGTNRADYEAGQGLSRTFAGNGSDGLVRIDNATVWGTRDGATSAPTAKAFVFRSHSGPFGIVNSEEAYQNLTRFLFGDIRVELWVDIDELTLPTAVEQKAAGKPVDALYQFEVLASPRGKLWYLTRRVAEEDSVACLRHVEYLAAGGKTIPLHLSTVFLANRGKVDPVRKSLAYSMTLGIRVPDYEIDRKLWVNEHYEGGYLFRDSAIVELVPPDAAGGQWTVRHDWQSDDKPAEAFLVDPKDFAKGAIELRLPFPHREKRPNAKGNVRFVVRAWNVGRT